MNTRQIECFFAAAESRSMREAGLRVYASVSTISRQIASLEEELQLQLFLREGSGWDLTEAGQIMYRCFRREAQQLSQDLGRARAAQARSGRRLRIGFFACASPDAFFLELFARFKQAHPEEEVELICCEVLRQEQFLREDQCDVIFAFDWQIPQREEYVRMPVDRRRSCLYIGKNNEALQKPDFRPADLRSPTVWFITSYDRAVYERQVYDVLHYFGLENWHIEDAGSWDTAWMNVAAGQGIIVSDPLVAAYRSSAYVCYPIPPEIDAGNILACWKKNNRNPLLDLFADTVRDYAAGRLQEDGQQSEKSE